MRGHCFCAAVEFEIDEPIPDLYQCHCSLCRRVSGSSANAATIVEAGAFRWLRGEDQISRYVSETGFKSDFFRNCGSPLPNPTRDDEAWWVPVGLLDDNASMRLVAHVCTASKASWDQIASSVRQYEAMPDRDDVDRLLRSDKSV